MSEAAAKAPKVPREIAAEAAVWLTRLHGPHRTPQLEVEFKLWLEKEPMHALAFERATATWDAVQGISAATAFRARARPARPAFPRWVAIGAGACATLLIAATGWYGWTRDQGYTTAVGEQRSISLADGSRVFLNTKTRVVPRAAGNIRRVDLEEGEALFEVAKDPSKPFVVHAGGKTITALGTTFEVRRNGDVISVTLIEGKVVVADASSTEGSSPQTAKSAILTPGERLSAAGAARPTIDKPLVEQVTAWSKGEVIFDGTPLSQAVEELNRYNQTALTVDNAAAGALKVSGVFRIGDSEAFARAVASVHGLVFTRDSNRLVLSLPALSPRS